MSITTRNQFTAAAKSITAIINGQALSGQVKQFSTGSCGWYVNGKVDVAAISAAPLTVVIAGTPLQADFREFSSGNRGWYLAGKVMVPMAGGELVRCQVSASMTLVGSKSWAAEAWTGVTSCKMQCGINVIAIGSKTWEYGEEVSQTQGQVAADERNAIELADLYNQEHTESLSSPVVQPQAPNLLDGFMATTPVVATAASVNLMDAFYVSTPVPATKTRKAPVDTKSQGGASLIILRTLSANPKGLTGNGINKTTGLSGAQIMRWAGYRSDELNAKGHKDSLINLGYVKLESQEGAPGLVYVITAAGRKYLATKAAA